MTGTGRERAPETAPVAATPGPSVLPGGYGGAAAVASQVGNRAFSRAVAPISQAPGPRVNRIVLPVIVAGGIWAYGEDQGWWGGDKVDASKSSGPGTEAQAALLQRAQGTLNSQIIPGYRNTAAAIRSNPEAPDAVLGHISAIRPALLGLGLPNQYSDATMTMANHLRDGMTMLTGATMSFDQGVAFALEGAETAQRLCREVLGTADPAAPAAPAAPSGGPAPAPAPTPAPAPAPAPAKAPDAAPGPGGATPAPDAAATLTPDQRAALEGIIEELGACKRNLDPGKPYTPALRQREFLRTAADSLTTAMGSAPQAAKAKLEEAARNARNAATMLHSLSRTDEERSALASGSLDNGATSGTALVARLAADEKALRAAPATPPAAG